MSNDNVYIILFRHYKKWHLCHFLCHYTEYSAIILNTSHHSQTIYVAITMIFIAPLSVGPITAKMTATIPFTLSQLKQQVLLLSLFNSFDLVTLLISQRVAFTF